MLEKDKPEEPEKKKKGKPTLAQTLGVDDEEDDAAPVAEEKPKRDSVYDQIAALAGEPDYETYWERHFEQLRADDTYLNAARSYAGELSCGRWKISPRVVQQRIWCAKPTCAGRSSRPSPMDLSRRRSSSLPVRFGADRACRQELPPMTDEELEKLRKRESKMTLMPYSFFKLSSQSGYGAGNHAPAYFEMVWNGFNKNLAASLPTLFLTNVVRELRTSGTFRSTAEVIEGVRLAEAMADMKNSLPTLRELQDAAVTLLGQGDPAVVRESLLRVEVGTAIGALAKGVSQTSIQDDFYRELTRLKLDQRSRPA